MLSTGAKFAKRGVYMQDTTVLLPAMYYWPSSWAQQGSRCPVLPSHYSPMWPNWSLHFISHRFCAMPSQLWRARALQAVSRSRPCTRPSSTPNPSPWVNCMGSLTPLLTSG